MGKSMVLILPMLQYHITPQDRTDAAKLGMEPLDYDGVAEVWVDSLDDWQQVLSDKQFMTDIPRKSTCTFSSPCYYSCPQARTH
jgi:hypothetical protein